MPPPIFEESSSDESIPAREVPKPMGKGGPLSLRSRAEQEEQAAVAARVHLARPASAPVAGARRATPCLPCVRSALGGRSSGACFELAGAQRANRCLRCSSGHKCLRLPSAVRAPARNLVSLLEAEADKKETAKAREQVRRLLKEHPEELSEEQPSEGDDDDDDDDDDDEDEDEVEWEGFEEEEEEENEPAALLEEQAEQPAVLSARRAELKKTAKAGLHALVELLFSDSE